MWKQEWDAVRGYDAAGHTRANANWRVSNESEEVTARYSRDTIRARARDLERNSDIIQAVLHAFKRNVVGRGFTLRAMTGDDVLDSQIEQLWKRWCRAENCSVTGEQSFLEILRMMVQRKKVDGGILILYRNVRGGMIPFQLQCLEVDELDQTQTVPRQKGNFVSGGVEYTPYNKPVGYWFRQYDIEGQPLQEPFYVRAEDVFFYKSRYRPSLLREVSDLAPIVTRIRDINEFITAVATKERVAASFGLLIKKTSSAGGNGRSAALSAGGRGQVDYASKRIFPGMIMEMGVGDDAVVIDPKDAANDAATFLKLEQGLIAAGVGISYEALSRDMNHANYSSARQNALEDENTYAEEIELLSVFLSEVYENFVRSAVLSGLLNLPDFWRDQEKYLAHTWIKTPKKWIDPVKEASADQVALRSGQKTFQDLQAEKGKDWREAIDEMAEAIAYGKEKGIDMGGVLFGTGTGTSGTNQLSAQYGGNPDAGEGNDG